MSGYVVLLAANIGGRCAWVVPTYKNARSVWRWVEQTVSPLLRYGVRINRSERIVEFPNGGFVGIYSADNPDSMRGDAYHVVVMDEGARQDERVFTDVILPTLADYDGDLLIPSTPNGKNWFWNEFTRGKADMHYQAAFHAPTSANPSADIQRAFAMAKERMPERTFREEWLAEFVEDGAVFRNVSACAIAVKQVEPIEGHSYLFGMDTAKLNDYSVITIMDTTLNEIVSIDKFNQIDYVLQLNRLDGLHKLWQPAAIVIESNNAHMFIEEAWRRDLPVLAFNTNQASKQLMIDALVLAFERMDIRIIDDETLLSELHAFAAERLPGGTIRYSAPSGQHDDHVMSLALVWYQSTRYIKPDYEIIG